MSSVNILGVRVDDCTFASAVEMVEAWLAQGGAYQIASVNPEFIMRAQNDETFARVLANTNLNVPDGVGALWAAKLLGRPLTQRVGGADLTIELCRAASAHGWRIFFLGARDGIAERAAALLAARFPGMQVAGAYAGSPRPEEEDDLVARVAQARPQLLFVAYGAPGQDVWLARNLPRLASSHSACPAIVGMGVGGTFDFVAGTQKRAPLWVQNAGFEWLYRLIREPGRIRRQMALPRFAARVMLESLRK